MTVEQRLLVDVLACAVAGKPCVLPENMDWRQFVGLCMKHSVAALAYDGLKKADLWQFAPPPAQKILSGAYNTAIFKDAQFAHLKEKLSCELKASGVRHIFLKGASLKKDYPVPELRTMCDLDVLVHTEDYPVIEKIAQTLRGVPGHSDGNHRNYQFPGELTVEFHPNLLHHGTPVGTQINPGWQYANKAGDDLTEEGFYLNTLCHLANHFVSGGAGVRFIADVWVNRNLRQPQPDWKKVEAELGRFGLLEFARNIEDLAECWFGRGEETELLQELGEYILADGHYGSGEKAVLNAVALSPNQSRSSALVKKAFYSRAELEDRYPWCKGKPLLLPAAWCARCFRAVTRHGKLVIRWSKKTGEISKNEIAEQKALLGRFGIRPEK